jgi:LmbE family N-acetylglucosaminyl deacetylase
MTRLRRRGVMVRVVVVADGAASHPGSTAWPPARLVRERAREARRALRRIGIPAGDVTFLRLPDGGLASVSGAIRRGIAAAAHRAPRPLLIVAPAASDDHPDHRAVAAAMAAIGGAGIRRLAYPVWPAGKGLTGARALSLTGQQRLAKRHAIRGYRTQTGRITDDPAGFALTPAQIAAFSRPAEWFVETRR